MKHRQMGCGTYPERVQPPHLVLVGMPGSGKSSVARRVARRTGRAAVDVDAEIERVSGRSIAEIFAAEGEAGFRALEGEVLAALLAGDEPLVIATGGGAVLRDENRATMRSRGVVVWLRATPTTLAARVGDGRTRPLLAGDPIGNLTRLLAERGDAYAAAAHAIVDVDRVPFDAITTSVIDAAAPRPARTGEVAG
jgi:shikimate kinase